MNKAFDEDLEKVLFSHKIQPTPQRIKILNAILTNLTEEFTIAEIDTRIKKEDQSASISSLIDTLKLFKNTGLIKQLDDPHEPCKKRGRSKIKYLFPHNQP